MRLSTLLCQVTYGNRSGILQLKEWITKLGLQLREPLQNLALTLEPQYLLNESTRLF